MSIEAMSWVLKLEMSRSSEKFVMVCLANYADERGVCYPSVPTLARDTGQDRKTIISNLKRLTECGLLRDTGQRIGRTSSVPVYQLVGMPSASGVHYVYKVTNLETGEFHIGMRSFNGDPELDVFRGSSRWIMDMQSREIPLHREVIDVFDNPVEARAAELRLFRELGGHALCRNEHAPHGASRELRVAHWESSAKNGTGSSGTDFGTAPSSAVFPASSTDFPASSTVFPPKQSQKRDTEPSVNPSVNLLDNPKPKKAAKKVKAVPAAPVVVLPAWLPESVWKDWVEHRAEVCKAPLSQRAAELCIAKLAKMRAAGHDPIAIVNASVMSGKWTDLYPIKGDHDQARTTAAPPGRPANWNPTDHVMSGAAYAHPATTYPNDPNIIDAEFLERASGCD